MDLNRFIITYIHQWEAINIHQHRKCLHKRFSSHSKCSFSSLHMVDLHQSITLLRKSEQKETLFFKAFRRNTIFLYINTVFYMFWLRVCYMLYYCFCENSWICFFKQLTAKCDGMWSAKKKIFIKYHFFPFSLKITSGNNCQFVLHSYNKSEIISL